MPALDKTGPQGQGAKTGRQRGNCENKTTNNVPSRGGCCGGQGRGGRRGWFGLGRCFGFTSKEDEIKSLEEQVISIQARIAELKS